MVQPHTSSVKVNSALRRWRTRPSSSFNELARNRLLKSSMPGLARLASWADSQIHCGHNKLVTPCRLALYSATLTTVRQNQTSGVSRKALNFTRKNSARLSKAPSSRPLRIQCSASNSGLFSAATSCIGTLTAEPLCTLSNNVCGPSPRCGSLSRKCGDGAPRRRKSRWSPL